LVQMDTFWQQCAALIEAVAGWRLTDRQGRKR
jgi:hypothetical protein